MRRQQQTSDSSTEITGASEPRGFKVGAVVIGRNEGQRLVRCLKSLESSCNTIVYVDSGSTDGSVRIATALGAKVVQLDLQTPFTAARARNAGFDRLLDLQPDLHFVQFVDGDCEVLPGWVEAARDFLSHRSDVAAVCGRRLERDPTASIYNVMCHHEWNTPVGQVHSCGGDFLIVAHAFRDVGGFSSEQIAHEEPELCGRLRRIGYRIWRIDRSMTLHDAALHHINQFYKRNRRAGFGIIQAMTRSGINIDPGGRAILGRSITWVIIVPILIVIALLVFGPAGGLAVLVYPAQILRFAALDRQGVGGSLEHRLKVAALTMLSKFAEAHGALEFLVKTMARREVKPIYYK